MRMRDQVDLVYCSRATAVDSCAVQPVLQQVANRMFDPPEELWQTLSIKITESGTNNEPDTEQQAKIFDFLH